MEAQIKALENDLMNVAQPNSKYIHNGQQDVNRYNSDRITLDQLRSRLTKLNLDVGSTVNAARDWNRFAVDRADAHIEGKLSRVDPKLHKALVDDFNQQFNQVISSGYFSAPSNQTLVQIDSVIATIFKSSLGGALIDSASGEGQFALPNNESDPGKINVPGVDDLTKTLLEGYKPRTVQTLAEKRRAELGVK